MKKSVQQNLKIFWVCCLLLMVFLSLSVSPNRTQISATKYFFLKGLCSSSSSLYLFFVHDLTHTKPLDIHWQHPRGGLTKLDQGNRDTKEEGFKAKQETHQKKSQHREQQNKNYLICWDYYLEHPHISYFQNKNRKIDIQSITLVKPYNINDLFFFHKTTINYQIGRAHV